MCKIQRKHGQYKCVDGLVKSWSKPCGSHTLGPLVFLQKKEILEFHGWTNSLVGFVRLKRFFYYKDILDQKVKLVVENDWRFPCLVGQYAE